MPGGRLIVAPHGLDEVLGPGAAAARWAEDGERIDTLILFGDGAGRDAERRVSAAKAAEILSLGAPSFCGLPENHGDQLRLGDMVGPIERAIAERQPREVLIPTAACLHIDHRKTHEAAVTALRPVPGSPVRRILGYEIVSSTDWPPPIHWPRFSPTLHIDVSATAARKQAALEAYAFEMRPEPHARSIPAVMRRLATAGATVGLEAAESFEVLREIA